MFDYILKVQTSPPLIGASLRVELVDFAGNPVPFADGELFKTGTSSNASLVEYGNGDYGFHSDQWNADKLPFTAKVFNDGTGDYLASAVFNVSDSALVDSSEVIGLLARLRPAPIPPKRETMTVVQGDDYTAADGRAFYFSSDTWPDLTGAGPIVWGAVNVKNSLDVHSANVSVVTAGSDCSQTVRLELNSATTTNFEAGAKIYRFDIQALFLYGTSVTLVSPDSLMTVLKDVSE